MTDLQVWKWTLTKESITPCFVRDVLSMRQSINRDTDFFWLGHTPCRTVLLIGMAVAIQVYDKRTIYTIDDGTAVIDCILRHPKTLPPPVTRSPPRSTGISNAKTNLRPSSPKKARLDRAKSDPEPPSPVTEPGHPVRVVGKVVRHFQSKQIHADTLDPCLSSLDEIAHLEHVIELHKTKYSLAVPFVIPSKPTPCAAPDDAPSPHPHTDADAGIFSNPLSTLHTGHSTSSYALSAPRVPMRFQNQDQPPSVSMHPQSTHHGHGHVPSSPTASSIASSTPSSPVKTHEVPCKPKLRHPSRLHTRDLTANTFRLYIKHYMDNAPPPFPTYSSPLRSTFGGVTTPTKRARNESECDEPTPRPRPIARNDTGNGEEDEEGPTLGFTLSHLRRVPELALLAALVVRAETRKRDKADREKQRANSRITSSNSASPGILKEHETGNGSMPPLRTRIAAAAADPPRKKIARLFSWAVVKLYEEGSIVLWDGDVRPLPVPPPPLSGLWNSDAGSNAPSASYYTSLTSANLSASNPSSASMLYNSSASASLYSQYHAPRRVSTSRRHHQHDKSSECDIDATDVDADPVYLSDPPIDEEAYVPLTPRFLAGYVRDAVDALRRGGVRGGVGASERSREGKRGTGREPTPEDVLVYMQRTDQRWARVGVWVVEEALTILKDR